MEYLHMSQVFKRFKHPALYVSNFYPLYAPGEYKDMILSDATQTYRQYIDLLIY